MKEQFQQKLTELQQMKEKLFGDINAISGAIQITQFYISELEKENTPMKENDAIDIKDLPFEVLEVSEGN